MATRWWRWGMVGMLLVATVACSSSNDDAAATSGDRSSAPDDAAGGSAQAESGSASGGSAGLPAGDPIQAGRSIIATATISVEVDDAVGAAGAAGDAAKAVGGFVADEAVRPADGRATVTLRVPSESFSDVVGDLQSLGDVQEQRLATEDVTEQVVDLESRITTARASVARVRDLLARSGDIGQLATVEGELSRREADLEALLGRQRVLDDQVSLATIHLDLREPEAVAEEPDEPLPGFFGGLRSGWDGFLTAASVVATGLGYALPFLVLAGLVGAAGLLVGRREPSAEG